MEESMATHQAQPNDGSDRRLHPRLDVMEYATLTQGATGAGQRCVIVDVSLGGLQARGKTEYAPGDRLFVEVSGNGTQAVGIYAEVKYCVPVEGAGMFATGMRVTSEDRHALRSWVDFVRRIFAAQSDSFSD
jgi:hypothetical protein